MSPRPGSPLRRAVLALVTLPFRLYRHTLGLLLPDACRFTPSCSHYAEQALATRGLVMGSLLTVWRLLRCQPFSKGGHDPVPPRPGTQPRRGSERNPGPGTGPETGPGSGPGSGQGTG